MQLRTCPIDGTALVKDADGEITCSAALIGSHSAAIMLQWLKEHGSPVKAPSSPKGLGAPCSACGEPRTAVVASGRYAYCEPCHSKGGGRPENMPTFSLAGPPPQLYYFDNGRMMR